MSHQELNEVEEAVSRMCDIVGRPAFKVDPVIYDKAWDLVHRKDEPLTPRDAARVAVHQAIDRERRLAHETGATSKRRKS